MLKASIEIQTIPFFLSTANEPVLTSSGSMPLNAEVGIEILDIPSDVPFLNFARFPIQRLGDRIPTKYRFPFSSKSNETGYVVPEKARIFWNFIHFKPLRRFKISPNRILFFISKPKVSILVAFHVPNLGGVDRFRT